MENEKQKNNQQTVNEADVLARNTINVLFVYSIPNQHVSVLRNNITGTIKVEKKQGIKLCFPFLFTKTLVKTTKFTKIINVNINTNDYSSVPMQFNVEFYIRDPKKFYDEFCGDIGEKFYLKLEDKELQKLYNRVLSILRYVVSANVYETIQKFKVIREMGINGETINIKGIHEQEDELKDSLNKVYRDYGIFFNTIELIDIDKPQELLEQERKEKNNESENRMKIKDAKAREESSRYDLNSAKNEAEAIKIKKLAEYGSPIEAYQEHSYTPEEAAKFEAMKNSNLRAVGNNLSSFINIEDEFVDDVEKRKKKTR